MSQYIYSMRRPHFFSHATKVPEVRPKTLHYFTVTQTNAFTFQWSKFNLLHTKNVVIHEAMFLTMPPPPPTHIHTKQQQQKQPTHTVATILT